MNARIVAVVLPLLAVPSFAEAGLPSSFCRDASCPCGTTTCTCGEACNAYTGQCTSGVTAYCTNDAMCAGSCNSFICENNACVVGTRVDAGLEEGRLPDGGLVDGGHVPGWIHEGDAGHHACGNDAGAPTVSDAGLVGGQSDTPPSSGCSTAPGLVAFIAVAAVIRRRAMMSR